MRKRARRVLTGLLVLCCAITGFVPVGAASAGTSETLQTRSPIASQSNQLLTTTGSWITATVRSIGTFFSSLYTSVRDFFVSGQALKLIETVVQAIEDFAVRLFAPLASVILPLLQRLVPGLSTTRELLAVWIFWIVVVLVLVVLILVLRPRRTAHGRLPKASPKTAGQGENSIEFGLVEQGPLPMTTTSSERPAKEQIAATPHEEPVTPAEPQTVEQPSVAETISPSIPEISLEPLGFFGDQGVAPEAQSVPASTEPTPDLVPATPLIELTSAASEPQPPAEISELIAAPPVEVPSEALLETPATESQALEVPVETPPVPFVTPDLTPIGQAAPAQPTEALAEVGGLVEPLGQPLPPSEAITGSEVTSEQNLQVTAEPEPTAVETETQVDQVPETAAGAQEAEAAPSGADMLSRLLEEEGAFQRLAKPVEATGPAETPSPVVVPQPTAESSIFAGDVDLSTLLQEGVVSDAAALGQLFGGGYRSQISKLAISAKDLQNVPEEIRNVVKLTIVALSPIELSIARDVAMRLEAPGFVGEALLVAKKMGYQNYLTTYKNISRNYKDVSIVETVSLKTPPTSTSDSGDGLISFS